MIIQKSCVVLLRKHFIITRINAIDFFDPDGHFTHVFMDEAGHAIEPEALNTVAGKTLILFSNLILFILTITSIFPIQHYLCNKSMLIYNINENRSFIFVVSVP